MTPGGGVAIQRLQPGDVVQSYNFASHRVENGHVVNVVRQDGRPVLQYSVPSGPPLFATAEHPIYSAGAGAFVPAGELTGAFTVLALNSMAAASEAEAAFDPTAAAALKPVYDLTVLPHHNYFANGILVHNKSPCHVGCTCPYQPCRDFERGVPPQQCSLLPDPYVAIGSCTSNELLPLCAHDGCPPGDPLADAVLTLRPNTPAIPVESCRKLSTANFVRYRARVEPPHAAVKLNAGWSDGRCAADLGSGSAVVQSGEEVCLPIGTAKSLLLSVESCGEEVVVRLESPRFVETCSEPLRPLPPDAPGVVLCPDDELDGGTDASASDASVDAAVETDAAALGDAAVETDAAGLVDAAVEADADVVREDAGAVDP
jgi:hypothetical protein